MDRDELTNALSTIKDYLNRVKWKTYPISKDYDWIESAIWILSEVIQQIADDMEVSGDD